MLESPLVIAACVFGVVLCAGYMLLRAFDRYEAHVGSRFREMFRHADTATAGKPAANAENEMWLGGRLRLLQSIWSRLLPDSGIERKRYHSRLVYAGYYGTGAPSTFLAAKVLLMVLPPLVGLVVGSVGLARQDLSVLAGCLLGAIGMVLPSFWLDSRVRGRHAELRRSVPDFLDLMTVCLEGGLSLQGAIQRVGEELRIAHPLLAGELGMVQRDLDLGVSVDGALRRLADRTGFDGLRSLSAFVRESQRLGTELAQALRIHADMLRVHREQSAEELAQKASVKILFPTLLLILPAVFVVLAGPAAIQIQQAFAKH